MDEWRVTSKSRPKKTLRYQSKEDSTVFIDYNGVVYHQLLREG